MNRDFDNPIDNPLDLGFVNYVQHPENKDYVVFRFSDIHRANDFETLLTEQKIWFERDKEMKRTVEVTLFGIHKTDYNKAQSINFQVEGKHKKPLIPFKGLRYSVLIIGLSLLTLAIVGYCKRQDKLQSVNETLRTINKPQ